MLIKNAGRLLRPLLVASVVVLTACGGLGNGTRPVSAILQPFGGLPDAVSTKTFTCLNTGLSLFVVFSDGSVGDFTSRATYTSSNPAVAKVSNRDIAVPEQSGLFFQSGIIVPVATGTATITAKYLNFTKSIDVTVGNTENFQITPSAANLAAGSLLDLSVSATLDGVETSLDTAVQWAMVAPNDAIATIDANSGTISGKAVGTGLKAQVRIPGCSSLTAEANVTVANLSSLAVSRESGYPANGNLIVGTTELLSTIGTLDNSTTQDLSSQVTYTSSDSTTLSFFSFLFPNMTLALAATSPANTPVQVQACFPAQTVSPVSCSAATVTSPTLNIIPVTDTLNSIAINPATAVDVKAGRTTQFHSVGTFASGATQDITRHVGWSSSDATLAGIQSSGSGLINALAGLATTASTGAGKSVTITATDTAATLTAGQTATATLNITP